MRVSPLASFQIAKASRLARGRQKKAAAYKKKALTSLKAAKKALTRLKADSKETVKQFAAHMAKVEEYFGKVEELGGESPSFLTTPDWEQSLTGEIQSAIESALADINEIT